MTFSQLHGHIVMFTMIAKHIHHWNFSLAELSRIIIWINCQRYLYILMPDTHFILYFWIMFLCVPYPVAPKQKTQLTNGLTVNWPVHTTLGVTYEYSGRCQDERSCAVTVVLINLSLNKILTNANGCSPTIVKAW